jgi:hypothetical protein
VNDGDRAEQLFLYVADALEDAERVEVEAWIAASGPEGARALADAEGEVARVAAAQRPVAPRRETWERLARRMDASRARVAAPRRRMHPALAAGLGALAAAGVAGVVLQRNAANDLARDTALQAEIAEVRALTEELQAERDELDTELGDAEARLRALESDQVLAEKTIDVLHAEHAESLALTGAGSFPDAKGRVFWDWDTWYCYLRASGLPQDPDKIYAVWLFTEDDVIGVGTFRGGEDGTATFLGPVPQDVGHVLRAAVSIEPDEDLGTKPRGEIVLTGAAPPSGPS